MHKKYLGASEITSAWVLGGLGQGVVWMNETWCHWERDRK